MVVNLGPSHLGGERKLRVFENRLQKNIFGLKRDEVTRGEDYIMRSLMICNPHHTLVG